MHLAEFGSAMRQTDQMLGTAFADLPDPHKNDSWGNDPFRYHFMNAIARECMDRFAGYHGITVPTKELRAWSLAHADLHEHTGDFPDYMALMIGVYYSWINWEKAGIEPPEGWAGHDDRQATWGMLSPDEIVEEMKAAMQLGIDLLNQHDEENN